MALYVELFEMCVDLQFIVFVTLYAAISVLYINHLLCRSANLSGRITSMYVRCCATCVVYVFLWSMSV